MARGSQTVTSFLLTGLVLGLGLGSQAVAQLPAVGGSGSTEPPVVATAEATVDPTTGAGLLKVTAKIKSGWHIYSVTQKPGGPLKTKIKIDPKSGVELAGEVKVLTAPHSAPEPAFNNLLVETHEGEAVWEVPVKAAAGVDLHTLQIKGAVNAQACSESCLPPTDYKFTAKVTLGKVAAPTPPPATQTEDLLRGFRPEKTHAVIRGRIEPAEATPGSVAQLVISAEPEPHWHVYALADREPQGIGPRPTLIVLNDTGGLRFTKPLANAEPIEKRPERDGDILQFYYETPVQWTVKLEVPADTKPGAYSISGMIGLQTCESDKQCDPPRGVSFQGVLKVGDRSGATPAPLTFDDVKYAAVAKVADGRSPSVAANDNAQTPTVTPDSPKDLPGLPADYKVVPLNHNAENATLPVMIFFGLVGGLILNLMPCVLPVIGLKILSFAEQAGKNRAKILTLNLWYSAGIVAVFLVLATLAAGAKLGFADKDLGWGEQFSSTTFNVAMACLVFSMALSFLGVWELPIPGFASSGKAQKLAAKEGPSGAFVKGVVTTILATPCSGPFLGPVFGFTLVQPPAVTYVIFTAIGVGMALPYLVIGAFPQLIRWLPKPGAWMDTFKQIMGFFMLGTVAYIFSFMQKDYLVPTFALLIGVWAACWWIGRTPGYEPLSKRVSAWVQGLSFAALVGLISFTQLIPGKEVIAWQPFSRSELTRLTSEGKTVLVDFSADWCPTCKLNLRTAINTQAVASELERNDVVPMLADWTDGSDEIKEMLATLGYRTIPVLAAFPASRPGEVLVLSDIVSKGQVLEMLKKAGPSRAVTNGIARVTASRDGG